MKKSDYHLSFFEDKGKLVSPTKKIADSIAWGSHIVYGYKEENRSINVHWYSLLGKNPDDSIHEGWNLFVDQMQMNLSHEIDLSSCAFETEFMVPAYRRLFGEFFDAIVDYRHQQKECDHIKEISEKSAKNFLYLLPIFSRFSPKVVIDADTGYFNTTFIANDDSILSALVTDRGEIYFSLVGQGRKIFKISGTAKLKDSRDFEKFSKILAML